ncbi:MAG: DUF4905 domain-containing protein [Pelobium sp.]
MLLTKDTPKLLYRQQCEGIIWKLELDEVKEIMVWECRNENKKVSFYAYDFKNECTALINYTFKEEWLLGLDYVNQGIAYFHGSESEFSPVHKGLIAFDIKAQKIIWEHFNISLQSYSTAGVLVFDPRLFPRKYQLLDLITGNHIKLITVDELSFFSPTYPQVLFPKNIENAKEWDSTQELSINDLTLKSGYEKEEGQVHQYLKIIRTGQTVFKDYLGKNIQKQSFDTFFVWQNKLIYVRNKSEILTYLL